MNLDYSVLWIDDRPRQVQQVKEHLKVKLARKGFNLSVKEVDKVTDERTLRKHFTRNDFDLMIVDYQMQPGEMNGDQLIKLIRNFCDTTDIVFYSSDKPSNLRKKIDVDGVYCANRNHLTEKLDDVIHSTIRKVLDLNAMRGISLAQLADFDHLIDGVISKGFEKIEDERGRDTIVETILSSATNFHKKSYENLEGMSREGGIEDYLILLSSRPKFDILRKVIELLDQDEIALCSLRVAHYEKDIIQPRNKLAHAMFKKYDSGTYTLENNSKEISFGEDEFKLLRLKLLDYMDGFKQIENLINSL